MLLLSVIGLVVPAVFHRLAHGSGGNGVELKLDTEIAVVLFVTYCASLVFTLRTHRDLYRVTAGDDDPSEGGHGMSLKRAVIVLFASTAAVAVVSELLVSSVSETARELGMTDLFVGVVIVRSSATRRSISRRSSLRRTTRWTRQSRSRSGRRPRLRCSSRQPSSS
jgi:Ca2+:H+ antiporter